MNATPSARDFEASTVSRARPALRWTDAAAALVLAAGVLMLALPHALSAWQLTADSIEYLGIAHSFSSGAGFVDPVVYSHYLPPQYPMPAAAMRPPLVPLLLAIPIGLGATIETTGVLHVVWAALVAIGVFLVARRWASLPSALAAATSAISSLRTAARPVCVTASTVKTTAAMLRSR